MRTLVLTGLLCLAVPAGAQTVEPVSCKAIATQVTMKLIGIALEGESVTPDEKRVFGEFQRGVVEECVKADGENCYTRNAGSPISTPTNCKSDPVRVWMTTSASQIIPTQTKQNRATQILGGLLNKTPEPAPATAAPAPAPVPPPIAVAQPTAPPPPPPVETPPPPPPPTAPALVAEDAPTLEGDALLNRPLVNLSQRELRGTQTLLEEQKPGLGLTIGMYAGGAGALAAGSFFIANSVGYYVATFGVILGAAALTAGVVMIVVGSIALVRRLRVRALYNVRIEEIRSLLRKPKSDASERGLPTMVTLASWP